MFRRRAIANKSAAASLIEDACWGGRQKFEKRRFSFDCPAPIIEGMFLGGQKWMSGAFTFVDSAFNSAPRPPYPSDVL